MSSSVIRDTANSSDDDAVADISADDGDDKPALLSACEDVTDKDAELLSEGAADWDSVDISTIDMSLCTPSGATLCSLTRCVSSSEPLEHSCRHRGHSTHDAGPCLGAGSEDPGPADECKRPTLTRQFKLLLLSTVPSLWWHLALLLLLLLMAVVLLTGLSVSVGASKLLDDSAKDLETPATYKQNI